MRSQQLNYFDRIHIAQPYILCCIISKSFGLIHKSTCVKQNKHCNPPDLQNHIQLRCNRIRNPGLARQVCPCMFVIRTCIPCAPFYPQPHRATAQTIPHRHATIFNRCALHFIARKRSAIMQTRQHQNGARVEARLRPPA